MSWTILNEAGIDYASAPTTDQTLGYPVVPPATRVGDYVVHHAAGAYNSNMSPEFIFELPPTVFF